MEIPVIDAEEQIAKGVDQDIKSYHTAHQINLALPWEDDGETANFVREYLNESALKHYPDGPTPEMLDDESYYRLNIDSYQQRREAIFRGIGGVTTLALLEEAETPYAIDYFRDPTINDDGESRTRTAWTIGRDIPDEYLEMFDIVPPEESEVAIHEARAVSFYDHGEYYFPVFQFGYHEGESTPFYITALERALGIEKKYPSHSAMLDWITKFRGTKFPLHEFIREENFNPDKLWDIYWQSLGGNPRNIFGGPSAMSKDDGRPA